MINYPILCFAIAFCKSDKTFIDHWSEHVALSMTIFTYLPFYLPLKEKQIYIRIGPNVGHKGIGDWVIGRNGKKWWVNHTCTIKNLTYYEIKSLNSMEKKIF